MTIEKTVLETNYIYILYIYTHIGDMQIYAIDRSILGYMTSRRKAEQKTEHGPLENVQVLENRRRN